MYLGGKKEGLVSASHCLGQEHVCGQTILRLKTNSLYNELCDSPTNAFAAT